MEVSMVTSASQIQSMLWIIQDAGRMCYNSEPELVPEKRDNFIRRLIASGHESVIEHGMATFRIDGISRACSHQLVRHRLASYSQRSQRYVKEEGFDFVVPKSILKNKEIGFQFGGLMLAIADIYSKLIDAGIPKEDARFVLPNACVTQLTMTMNFRELRHFIKLRAASNAQWEIRELATKIRDLLKQNGAEIIVEDLYND